MIMDGSLTWWMDPCALPLGELLALLPGLPDSPTSGNQVGKGVFSDAHDFNDCMGLMCSAENDAAENDAGRASGQGYPELRFHRNLPGRRR